VPTPWAILDTSREPAATNAGPFPHRPFLVAAERTASTEDADLVPIEAGGCVMMLVRDGGGVRFAGPASLTDYHSPLGIDPAGLSDALGDLSGSSFRFDSLPREACSVVTDALDRLEAVYTVREHEATAVVELPSSFDGWLASIGRKERHEVRRKRRRFIEEFGEIEVVEAGVESLDDFCLLHRSSAGEKGSFMTVPMQEFFGDLLTTAGATIHHLVCEGRIRASAFGFETPEGYYYYNSAYDPDAAMASPGVVLFSSLIDRQIARGAAIFDFLKGDEPYKYRHGARRRVLFVAEGHLP
jgi:CelD/BcsL family acetyltransferase involved in cellulose biosynthesis